MADKDNRNSTEPSASRPHMPGYGVEGADAGQGLLPWNWAVERLTESHGYWVATSRPDGSPHCMPVWGVWIDQAFYFSSGEKSRKARNLASNPKCVITTDDVRKAIVLEGTAELCTDEDVRQRFGQAYQEKYGWDMSGFSEPVYVVRPRVAFAFNESDGKYTFTGSATRWAFGVGGSGGVVNP